MKIFRLNFSRIAIYTSKIIISRISHPFHMTKKTSHIQSGKWQPNDSDITVLLPNVSHSARFFFVGPNQPCQLRQPMQQDRGEYQFGKALCFFLSPFQSPVIIRRVIRRPSESFSAKAKSQRWVTKRHRRMDCHRYLSGVVFRLSAPPWLLFFSGLWVTGLLRVSAHATDKEPTLASGTKEANLSRWWQNSTLHVAELP